MTYVAMATFQRAQRIDRHARFCNLPEAKAAEALVKISRTASKEMP